MKKYLPIPIILLLALFLMVGSAMALPLTTSSAPVLMIDGVNDGDTTVDIAFMDVSNKFEFGFIDDVNNFMPIVAGIAAFGTYQFEGGSVVDFAINDLVGGGITRASEGTAEMYFSGDIDASYSQKPIVLDDYWQNLTITWTFMNNDIVANLSGIQDGFAPAPVPEPATMLMLGCGLLGIAGAGRKKLFRK